MLRLRRRPTHGGRRLRNPARHVARVLRRTALVLLILGVLLTPFGQSISQEQQLSTAGGAISNSNASGQLAALDLSLNSNEPVIWQFSGTTVLVIDHVREHELTLPMGSVGRTNDYQMPPARYADVGPVQIVTDSFARIWADSDGAMAATLADELTLEPATNPSAPPDLYPSRWPASEEISQKAAQAKLEGSEGTVHVEGTFRFILGDASFAIDGTNHWAGTRWDPALQSGNPLVDRNGPAEERVVEVFVENGRLDIALAEPSVANILMPEVSIQSSGPASFSNPRDPATNELLGSTLRFEAEWSMDIARQGDALLLHNIQGEHAFLDSKAISFGPEPERLSPWWALAALPLVAGFLAARPPHRVVVGRMERALAAADYSHVARMRSRRVLRGDQAPQASLYRATALLALGIFQEASLFLAGLDAKQRPDAATFHFLSAHAAAGLGSSDAAREHLQTCLALAPEYAEEASAIPALAELLSAPAPRFDGDYYS